MDKKKNTNFFEHFANRMTAFTGSSYAFITAVTIVILWAFTGPVFDFSETWQLVINTGTTIITFLMVFLIQKTQNKDSKAIQLKLNELIAANAKASNRMVDIEDLTEEELDEIHEFYKKLSALTKKEIDIHQSHSIDAAEKIHRIKKINSPAAEPKPGKIFHQKKNDPAVNPSTKAQPSSTEIKQASPAAENTKKRRNYSGRSKNKITPPTNDSKED